MGEAQAKAAEVGGQPLGAGRDNPRLGQLQPPIKDAGVFPLRAGIVRKIQSLQVKTTELLLLNVPLPSPSCSLPTSTGNWAGGNFCLGLG